MTYDALTESVALIGSGTPDRVPRLSRRRRTVPLAVDVVGAPGRAGRTRSAGGGKGSEGGGDGKSTAAVTCILRRGIHGASCVDLWFLARVSGRWQLLGGAGGGDGDWSVPAPRPSALELGEPVRVLQGGSIRDARRRTARRPGRGRGWGCGWGFGSRRHVQGLLLQVATEVVALEVRSPLASTVTLRRRAGRVRRIEVPAHGYVVLAWDGDAPRVRALSAGGESLGTLDVRGGATLVA